jgi:hypothetical protein
MKKNNNLNSFQCKKCGKLGTELIYSDLCKVCSKKWVIKKTKVECTKPTAIEKMESKVNSLLSLFKSIEIQCDRCKESFNGADLVLHHKEFSPLKEVYDSESNYQYLCKKCYREIAR